MFPHRVLYFLTVLRVKSYLDLKIVSLQNVNWCLPGARGRGEWEDKCLIGEELYFLW